MGHSVILCDECGDQVMESRSSWECDCGWTYPVKRDFTLSNGSKYESLFYIGDQKINLVHNGLDGSGLSCYLTSDGNEIKSKEPLIEHSKDCE